MARNSDTNHRERSQTAYYNNQQAEHQTEGDVEGQAQTDWAKKGNESWRTTRQEEFLNNLEARDEKAASAFSSERNLTDFQKYERKQVLEHTVEAFNQMDFVTPEDRHEAAQLVAQTLFNPMYKEIDLTEAKTDARFDSKLIQTLETEGISDYRILEKADGSAELHFQVNSLEQYGRIQEQSGYAVRLIEIADYANTNVRSGDGGTGTGHGGDKEVWEPSGYRAIVAEAELDTDVDPLEMQKLVDAEKDKFVRALTGSLHAPGFTVENMDRALEYANSYAVGDQTTLELDADLKHLLDQDPERAAQLAEVRMETNFSVLDNAIRSMGHDDPKTADGLEYLSEAVRDVHLENIFQALENKDQTMFHIARDNAKDNADLMAHAVSHGVGLVHMDGYQPPDFPPERFTSRDDINGYVTTYLPGLDPVDDAMVVPPLLLLYDHTNLPAKSGGHGAPLSMRVWIESIMSISLSQRDYAGRMVINTREIIDWLWPNGTFRPVRHMEHLNRALTAVNNSLIPWRGGYWAAVLVRNYPGTPDDEIVMEIELPPGSGRGPLVHRVVLRRYGVQSAALYRAYLAAAYMWDEFGTHAGKVIQATRPSVLRDAEGSLLDSKGRKIADRDGQPVRRWSHPKAVPLGEREPNPAASRYPVLSEYDLMRMVNATGTDHSRAAKIAARKAFEKMAEDEVITLESGLKAANGRPGVRIMPPENWGPDWSPPNWGPT